MTTQNLKNIHHQLVPTMLHFYIQRGDLFFAEISKKLVNKIFKHPISSILWPCILLLMFAYSKIYDFYTSPYPFYYSTLIHPSNSFKSVEFISKLNTGMETSANLDLDFGIKSFAFQFDENILTKEFLLQFYDIQSLLFKNLNIVDMVNFMAQEDNIIVYSPLDYWNNNKSLIIDDNNILKTIHLNGWSVNNNHLQPLTDLQMFSEVEKLNGLTRTARILRIITYFKNYEPIINLLNDNLKSIKSSYPSLYIFNESNSQEVQVFSQRSWLLDSFSIYLIPIILITYSFLKFKEIRSIRSIKSILLLCLAFFVQFSLTISASLSIASIFYEDIKLSQIPLCEIIAIPLFFCIENVSRLIISISAFATELSFPLRIQKAVKKSLSYSTLYNIVSIFLLVLAIFFASSETSVSYCFFSIICIIINYFLTYTYFLTILIVDMNKVELQDLILISDSDNSGNGDNNKTLNSVIRDDLPNSTIETKGFSLLARFKKCSFFDSIFFFLFFLVIMILIILKWTDGIAMNLTKTDLGLLGMFLNKRGFAYELYKLENSQSVSRYHSHHLIKIFSPTILSNYDTKEKYENSITDVTYSSDLFYFFEFISFLIFSISTMILILKLTINDEFWKYQSFQGSLILDPNNLDMSLSPTSLQFKSKELVKGHVLDIVKLCTSSCPFIVSVGIDHKILVWSPLNIPIPIPNQLPVSPKFSPISQVVMSDSGSLITVFNKFGDIKCWSRLSMSWVWSINLKELVNDIPLESFFRRRTQVSRGRRKLVSRTSKLSKQTHTTLSEDTTELKPLTEQEEKKKMEQKQDIESSSELKKPKLKSRNKSTSSMDALHLSRTLSLDSNFDQSVNLQQLTYNSDMEFIIVLKDGTIVSVNCTSGECEKSVLSNSSILCAKKLVSPRVNDRIVGVKENGELVVSTVVNNKWRSRPVKIDTSNYNKGKSLITPALLSQYPEFSYLSSPTPPATTVMGFSINDNNDSNKSKDKRVDFNDDLLNDLQGIVMDTVPFVGMIVRAFGFKCQLIDVQTGTVLKEWQIGKFKANTFKVFHPEPSHCRFCGCASVASFSIAYTHLETNSLILHTFSIDNRAKNNICLRVERDSRETRCLGFASVTEHQHSLSNVEGWCSTDLNILMGVRKKENNEHMVHDSNSNAENLDGRLFSKIIESDGFGLRKRQNKMNITDGQVNPRTQSMSNSCANEDIMIIKKSETAYDMHKLSDIWEGWTMTADGEVKFYEIPNGSDSGLLIKKLGPVCKFGHKSIVVSFGNIMKILYLGNDNLIEEGEPDDENKLPTYQTTGSLSFINRRRKLRMKKYDLTHSTIFEDNSLPAVVNMENGVQKD